MPCYSGDAYRFINDNGQLIYVRDYEHIIIKGDNHE
jgi:catalase